MTSLHPLTCDKCGREAAQPSLHTLPDGWERIHGDDFCPTCLAPIFAALKTLQQDTSR